MAKEKFDLEKAVQGAKDFGVYDRASLFKYVQSKNYSAIAYNKIFKALSSEDYFDSEIAKKLEVEDVDVFKARQISSRARALNEKIRKLTFRAGITRFNKIEVLNLLVEAPLDVRKATYNLIKREAIPDFLNSYTRNDYSSERARAENSQSILSLMKQNNFDVQKTLDLAVQELQEEEPPLKNIPKIKLRDATPMELMDLLLKNRNIPVSDFPKIIESIKTQEKRGDTKETQENLLNSSIQSWNNYYNMKALPQNTKIKILPSESKNFRREHAKYYYQVLTVKQALDLDFFINNCKCSYQLVA